MSSEQFFRTSEEELARLNSELAEIRDLMRDVSTRLGQIERHVKRAFGVTEIQKTTTAGVKETGPDKPSISPGEALEVFRKLTDVSRAEGSTAVEERLEQMTIPDLKVMAHELGVSFSSKPTRRNLHAGIRGRVSESVMLSQNRNVTLPRSEQSGEISVKAPDSPLKAD
jgi:hypothetical protein